jgi:Zn-dependent M28 family amino/carboxypeptidase
VLKGRPRPRFTVEFLFFDGEEAWGEWRDPNHTYGSRHYVTAARTTGTLSSLKALILLDMIGDRGLNLRRDTNSTPWLTDIVWAAAKRLGHAAHFLDDPFPVEDDHIPFLKAGVPSVDLIDLDYADWHQVGDTLDKVSARSRRSWRRRPRRPARHRGATAQVQVDDARRETTKTRRNREGHEALRRVSRASQKNLRAVPSPSRLRGFFPTAPTDRLRGISASVSTVGDDLARWKTRSTTCSGGMPRFSSQ